MVHTDLLVCRDHIEISAAITVPSPPQADVLLVQGGAVEAAHIVDAGLGRLGGIPDQCGPLSLVELLHYCALIEHPNPPTRGFGTQNTSDLLAPRWFFMAQV